MICGPEDILRFGKHKGKSIRQIYEDDPTYIRWALSEIDNFQMSDKDRGKALQVSYSYEQDQYENNDWGALGDLY